LYNKANANLTQVMHAKWIFTLSKLM